MLSIPDWSATPYASSRDRDAISREIQAFNDAARALTEAARHQWVDVTTASRAMLHEPSMAVADGLHPSGEMYRRWAELLLPIVTALS